MTISAATGTWTIGDNWPWPQMIFTSYYNLAVAIKGTKLALYELINTANVWTATEKCELGLLTNVISVSIADFGLYYILAVDEVIDDNIDKNLYIKNVSTGNVAELSIADMPTGTTCCAHQGQLIIGGLYAYEAPWEDVTKCSVAWSDIGSVNMNPEDYVTAGYAVMPWDENGNGEVWKVLSLGKNVRVYGDQGICNLIPYLVNDTAGYGVSEIETPGIISSDAVAGDELIHAYVDNNYDFWVVTSKGPNNLGYRKQMETLTNRILVRYDSHNKKFYISDGVYCFVFNGKGMYTTNQCMSSIGNYNGITAGFFKDNDDTKIRLVTSSTDFGYQSNKTIESVETGMIYDTDADEVLSGAVSVKYDYKGDFMQLPWITLNERGIFTQKVTGREFKIHLQADYESGADFSFNSLIPRIKFSDKRNIRGRLNVS